MALIADGDSLIFDAGSTVLQMVPHLAQFNNITVMTNSLTIVNALVELDNDQTILMPGGTYRKNRPRSTAAWPNRRFSNSASTSCLSARTASISTPASPPSTKCTTSAKRCAKPPAALFCW